MRHFKLAAMAACLSGALVVTGCGSDDSSGDKKTDQQALHVPSPDNWEDQIIYFVMPDRFNDGDPSNNDQGANEYDPQDPRKYSGGDLKGLTAKLDYIRELGATAVWTTPWVANQWWDPIREFGGYHGYWARNFMEVDEHMGTLEDVKDLSRGLHSRGMYLIQDVILNHMGNFFTYSNYNPANPTANVVLNMSDQRGFRPTQYPFSLNNPMDPAHYQAGIYNWTPEITNFNDERQRYYYSLGDLDDLNTDNQLVKNALKDSYSYWIKEAGVDAFRVDTILYVKNNMVGEWLSSNDSKHPGVLNVAESTGRKNFFTFGEAYSVDKPYEDSQEAVVDSYMTDPVTGRDYMHGMLNFPLYGSVLNVFAKGAPTAELGYRMGRWMSMHKRPHLMPLFLDNHDTDRFLNGASQDALRQGLLYMMTVPGVPIIWQGTEQGMTASRASMFAGGWGSEGVDHFNTQSDLFKYTQSVIQLRKNNAVLRRGLPTILKSNGASAGVLSYKMNYGAESALIIFNTADDEVLLDNLETGYAAGAELKVAAGLKVEQSTITVGANGRLTMPLPARAALVLLPSGKTNSVPPQSVQLGLEGSNDVVFTDDFTIGGTAAGVASVKVVVDGALDLAQTAVVGSDGKWTAKISVEGMFNNTVRHTVVAYDPASNATSSTLRFVVDRPFVPLTSWTDPAGDDKGPSGTYRYPTGSDWLQKRQPDLHGVTLYGSGPTLKLALKMNSVTDDWKPTFGFDHVAYSIFIDIPGKTGQTVMPFQNASVPVGMDWDYRLRVHGWSNALFSSVGAAAGADGTSASPAAAITVDKQNNTVNLILSSKSLGGVTSLQGVKVYVTTWDYDNGYRRLVANSSLWEFSGGNGATDPLVLDDTPVLTIP